MTKKIIITCKRQRAEENVEAEVASDDEFFDINEIDRVIEVTTHELELMDIIKNKSEVDLVSWADKVCSSQIDLSLASLACVFKDWPLALRKIISRMDVSVDLPVHKNHPLPNLFRNHFGEIISGVETCSSTIALVSWILDYVFRSRNIKHFRIFLDNLHNITNVLNLNTLIQNVYEFVKDKSGDQEKTLALQNEWLFPILNYSLKKGNNSLVFHISRSAIRHKNRAIVEFVKSSEDCLELLSRDPIDLQALSSIASKSGFVDESLFFFDRQKSDKNSTGVYFMLESGMISKNLRLIEKTIDYYGPRDAHNPVFHVSTFKKFLAECGREELFWRAFPNFKPIKVSFKPGFAADVTHKDLPTHV